MNLPQLERLGMPGVAGLGVLLFCLSFYAGNIAPARDELASLRSQAAQLSASARAAAPAGGEAAAPVVRPLPSFDVATRTLKELGAVADRHGVTVDRATYALSNRDGQLRLEISLPLKGGYPSLRAYVLDVLSLPAAPLLDELTLQRQQASEALLDANVRLSYYFSPPP